MRQDGAFPRALYAYGRNVPAITAWTHTGEAPGNVRDARSIFERPFPKFAAGSDAKVSLWRSYELWEQRLGEVIAAKHVYQRAIREAITIIHDEDDQQQTNGGDTTSVLTTRSSERELQQTLLNNRDDNEV